MTTYSLDVLPSQFGTGSLEQVHLEQVSFRDEETGIEALAPGHSELRIQLRLSGTRVCRSHTHSFILIPHSSKPGIGFDDCSGEHSGESKTKSGICPLLMKLGMKVLDTPESHSLWKKSKGGLNPAASPL